VDAFLRRTRSEIREGGEEAVAGGDTFVADGQFGQIAGKQFGEGQDKGMVWSNAVRVRAEIATPQKYTISLLHHPQRKFLGQLNAITMAESWITP
jgi:hypothetical protein